MVVGSRATSVAGAVCCRAHSRWRVAAQAACSQTWEFVLGHVTAIVCVQSVRALAAGRRRGAPALRLLCPMAAAFARRPPRPVLSLWAGSLRDAAPSTGVSPALPPDGVIACPRREDQSKCRSDLLVHEASGM